MRSAIAGIEVLGATAYSLLITAIWAGIILGGEGSGWRRTVDLGMLYIDLYGLTLLSVVSAPAIFFGLWRAASIVGGLPDREGPRWISRTLLSMAAIGLLVVAVRYDLWDALASEATGGKPTPPSDEFINFPALPLAPPGELAVTLEDLKGNKTDLASLKGKAVFFNIWATWCGFCILEFPNIQRLYDKLKVNPNVAFVIVSDEEPEKVKAWLAKEGKDYTMPFYLIRGEYPPPFTPRGYPTTHLIAPDGRIAFSHSGFAAWDGAKTQEFLSKLAEQPVETAPTNP